MKYKQFVSERNTGIANPREPFRAPIHGATRWQNDNPLIQLTGRYNRNDIFWFTFFHEAGHILLHGKKDVFIEGMEPAKDQKLKEAEANEFAVKWTLTQDEEQEIIDSCPITIEQVSLFAKKFGTHEALIIGRLAKQNHVHDSLGWHHRFFQKVELAISIEL
jgi:Zn-dependent peptidase ImmA (M78 family)